MKKSVLKKIKERAAILPTVMDTVHENHFVTADELREQGHTEWDGAPIVDGILYLQKMPVKIARNHENRMKEYYKREGDAGLDRYEDEIIELHLKHGFK